MFVAKASIWIRADGERCKVHRDHFVLGAPGLQPGAPANGQQQQRLDRFLPQLVLELLVLQEELVLVQVALLQSLQPRLASKGLVGSKAASGDLQIYLAIFSCRHMLLSKYLQRINKTFHAENN